jgi:hypothetical protein
MKTRFKAAPPVAEFAIVVLVILPISACSWANPWKLRGEKGSVAKNESDDEDSDEPQRKKIPEVKLSRDEQRIYNRYYTPPGRALGVSAESREIEERLGVN